MCILSNKKNLEFNVVLKTRESKVRLEFFIINLHRFLLVIDYQTLFKHNCL